MTVDQELVGSVLRLVADGTGWNPYFAYNHLSKDLRTKYLLSDVIWLFHRLEWHVKVIEIRNVSELSAWNPWKGVIGPHAAIQKKSVTYYLRPEFYDWFYEPNIRPKFIQKVSQYLDDESPSIDYSDLPTG